MAKRIHPVDLKLADALKAFGYPESVIDRAKMGEWSDFRTDLATPKMHLVGMLERDGHEELVTRVMAGEFDG